VIIFKNVDRTFAGKDTVHALKNINLNIPEGKIFGIIGQSGAGKSTLVRCINMLEKPDRGDIIVDGVLMNNLDAKELRIERKKIGMIFQHFNLLNSRTVFGNIAFPLELAGASKDEIKEKVQNLVSLVGLTDKLNAYPEQLSGGQKQRVGIARALATEPKLLLCDEATSALDPETTTSVLKLLQEINEKLQLTIVIITHEMSVIQEICDKVAVLENGFLQEVGPVIDVFTNPQSVATQRMLQGFLATNYKAQPSEISNTLLRLTFVDKKTHDPIISQMVRAYELDVNILFGRVDQMKETPFGMLLIELSGNHEKKENAITYLRNNGVKVEVLN